MDKKAMIIATVVAIAAIVGAAAIVALNDGEETKYKVLIEDQKGFYFWTEGTGENYSEVLSNTSAGVKVTMADTSFGKYISAVNGLEGRADYSAYWSVYYYSDGGWKYSEEGISSMKTSDYSAIALFYVECETVEPYSVIAGGPDHLEAVPTPEDAKVWNGNKGGMVFGLQSETGLYFYVNGKGETVFDAFSNATANYKIPFVKTESASGKGIKSIFGIGSYDTGVVNPETGYSIWKYWAQFYSKGGDWEYGTGYMSNLDTKDYSQCAIVFGTGGMGAAEGMVIPVYT